MLPCWERLFNNPNVYSLIRYLLLKLIHLFIHSIIYSSIHTVMNSFLFFFLFFLFIFHSFILSRQPISSKGISLCPDTDQPNVAQTSRALAQVSCWHGQGGGPEVSKCKARAHYPRSSQECYPLSL